MGKKLKRKPLNSPVSVKAVRTERLKTGVYYTKCSLIMTSVDHNTWVENISLYPDSLCSITIPPPSHYTTLNHIQPIIVRCWKLHATYYLMK